MGIKGLLRFMKPYTTPTHIKKYSGQRVGIDAYSWLHKGAYSCSMELVMDPACAQARRYLSYFMHRIELLRHYDVIPVVVFDGGNLPCKAATEYERRRRREENLTLAKKKYAECDLNAALEFFQRAVDITPEMAHQLIKMLRMEGVEFIVAPYEADAQLAYMSKLGPDQEGIAAVITEDSDLIAYGCQSIIFKMDRWGNGEEIMIDDIFSSRQNGPFSNFDSELLTGMCVLAGCDFLSSVPGIGIIRAHKLVSKYRNLDRVLSVLVFEKKQEVPKDYVGSFRKATAVFHHARIYDFKSKSLKLMKPLSEKFQQFLGVDLDVLGPDLPPSVAVMIAEGFINPITKKAFDGSSKIDHDLKQIPIKGRDYFPEPIRHGSENDCFRILSTTEACSQTIRAENLEEQKQDTVKYSKEAAALAKLMVPLRQEKTLVNEEERKAIPDNNPFKRRKKLKGTMASSCSPQSTEQESTVTVAENVEEKPLSGLLESQESVKSMRAEAPQAQGRCFKECDKATRKSQSSSIAGKKVGILRFFPPMPF